LDGPAVLARARIRAWDARADGTARWSVLLMAPRTACDVAAARLLRALVAIAASPVTAGNGADDGSTINTTKRIEQSLDHHEWSERRDN
jgi:hypothetical protein